MVLFVMKEYIKTNETTITSTAGIPLYLAIAYVNALITATMEITFAKNAPRDETSKLYLFLLDLSFNSLSMYRTEAMIPARIANRFIPSISAMSGIKPADMNVYALEGAQGSFPAE